MRHRSPFGATSAGRSFGLLAAAAVPAVIVRCLASRALRPGREEAGRTVARPGGRSR